MDVTRTDESFIRLLSGTRCERVSSVLRLRPERLADMSGLRSLDRGAALRDSIRLAAQVLAAVGRRSSVRSESLFFERSSSDLDRRAAFLRRFLGQAPAGVARDSRIVAHRTWLRSLLTVLGVIRILISPRAAESRLASAYVGILRSCLIVGSHCQSMGARDAYLFRAYRPETPFVAAWLMRAGVRVHQIASTSPLLPNTRSVVADSVVLCNPFQQDELAWLVARGYEWPESTLWGPEEIVELEAALGWSARQHRPRILGLYTQGFRARIAMGSEPESSGIPQAEHEERLHRLLIDYLSDHPEMTLRVFPHPLERRVFRAEGTHYLQVLEGSDRVSIDWSETSSVSTFEEVGIGITTFSTVGFDRLYMGFPTLFFVTDDVERTIDSPFQRVFTRSESELQQAIADLNTLTPEEFMNELFGGQFGPPPRM